VKKSRKSVRDRLLELIKTRSYFTGKFILSSGRQSDYYIDGKLTTLDPEGAYLVGKLFFEKMREVAPDAGAVGGLTLGADPIVSAISVVSHLESKPLKAFIVRKESKGHGTGAWIEGAKNLKEGARVVIVEDVATTGSSSMNAVTKAKEAGYEVLCVIALVDRKEGALENLRKEGIKFFALYTIDEVRG